MVVRGKTADLSAKSRKIKLPLDVTKMLHPICRITLPITVGLMRYNTEVNSFLAASRGMSNFSSKSIGFIRGWRFYVTRGGEDIDIVNPGMEEFYPLSAPVGVVTILYQTEKPTLR